MNIYKWIILGVLLVALIGANALINKEDTTPDELQQTQMQKYEDFLEKQPKPSLKLGDAVVFETSKGVVRVAMYEKDCPKTIDELKRLVNKGAYNGLRFGEFELTEPIPTMPIKTEQVKIVPCEAYYGNEINTRFTMAFLTSEKPDKKINGNLLFMIDPTPPQIQGRLNIFGRIVGGGDVLSKLQPNTDYIKSARIEKLTKQDHEIYNRLIKEDKKALEPETPGINK